MSDIEIRAVADDDLDQYFDVRVQAFGRSTADRDRWKLRVLADPDTARLGAFRGSELVGALRVLPGAQWLEGHRLGMGGIASVVVRPEVRRMGVGRRLLFAALDWMRDHELVVSALHPASTRAYRRAGWELAGDEGVYAVPTRSLAALSTAEAPEVTRLTEADRGAIRNCYARYAPTRHGHLDRSPSFWMMRDEVDDEDGGYSYGVRVDGLIAGYVRYRQEAAPEGWGYQLRIDDFVAPDPATAAALWGFLGGHAMQVELVEVPAFVLDDLVLRLPEQDVRQVTLNRWMHRIVDLPAALAARGTRFVGSAALTIAVADPWPGAAAPVWKVQADGGALSVEPAADPGLVTDIGALSALSIGRFRSDALAAAGRIDGSASDRALLDAIFSAPRPELADDF